MILQLKNTIKNNQLLVQTIEGTLINYLFKELNKHRISCSIDPDNLASIKMVERLGFRKEAHFKQSILIDGEWYDDVVYVILKDEWNQ